MTIQKRKVSENQNHTTQPKKKGKKGKNGFGGVGGGCEMKAPHPIVAACVVLLVLLPGLMVWQLRENSFVRKSLQQPRKAAEEPEPGKRAEAAGALSKHRKQGGPVIVRKFAASEDGQHGEAAADGLGTLDALGSLMSRTCDTVHVATVSVGYAQSAQLRVMLKSILLHRSLPLHLHVITGGPSFKLVFCAILWQSNTRTCAHTHTHTRAHANAHNYTVFLFLLCFVLKMPRHSQC